MSELLSSPSRDRALARLLGSPDPYGSQIDGLGGGISSTSKVCILDHARHNDCDVSFTFGQVCLQCFFFSRANFSFTGNFVRFAGKMFLTFFTPSKSQLFMKIFG